MQQSATVSTEHLDVLIVGAGLSGVGAAYRLQTECPNKSYAILEGRESMGGTWDLFRYPGIRSDSDMFTLGYPFRPWKQANAIADGASILQYIRETASEHGIESHIRFGHHVRAASWSSSEARWLVEVGVDDETQSFSCNFLYLCSGYYSYEGGYLPEFPGRDRFEGCVVHPQTWPQELDYSDKRVVVIGSGATAVTLVPAMAEQASHVTMLQRSPTYITSLPARDPLADVIRKALPEDVAHRVVRWKNVLLAVGFYQFCRRFPDAAKKLIRSGVVRQLGSEREVDPHFSPTYQPWDQRLCLVPDADLFRAMKAGRASVVTDQIRSFTKGGIRLESGRELEADIIITATGLQLVACGGIRLDVDGIEVDLGTTFVYRGFMLSGVPNLAMCVGYTNASWTLRADLTSRAVCMLLNEMEQGGSTRATPSPRTALTPAPILNLTAGYITRSAGSFPKQGSKPPWRLRQNYVLDLLALKYGNLTEEISFSESRRPEALVRASTKLVALRRH